MQPTMAAGDWGRGYPPHRLKVPYLGGLAWVPETTLVGALLDCGVLFGREKDPAIRVAWAVPWGCSNPGHTNQNPVSTANGRGGGDCRSDSLGWAAMLVVRCGAHE